MPKRKEREEEAQDGSSTHHGSTIFVSNIPYTATSTDLQTLFSDIAPVRSAFVVTDKATRISKGVGYVSFAIKEDAERAVKELAETGIFLDGRNLRVQWAGSKGADPKPSAMTVKKTPTKSPGAVQDPLAIRTVVISGLPSSVDSNNLWKKIRKYEGAEKVEWPVKGLADADDATTAYAIFAAPAQAQDAISRLHAHIFKGAMLSATLKKRLDSMKGRSGKGGPSRSSRLIVRNLPWNIAENDLRVLFLPYGPIYSIHIPSAPQAASDQAGNDENKPNNTPKPKAKGFAFVWMLSRADAEKAIEGVNGKSVSSKDSGGSESRIVAVDWALSKDRWEEEKGKNLEGSMSSASESEEEDALGVHSDSESQETSSGEESGSEEQSDEEETGEEPTPTRAQLPPPEHGTTLFIRNVPFTATEDELRTLFRAFGPLRYARITIDHESGRSRGTAFVCFWKKEDADKAVRQAELLISEAGGNNVLPQNPFTLPSLLTPDPSSSLAQSLVLHGRTLAVSVAVTRDEAGKLKEQGERRREKEDKRNMYLMREGVIFPNTPAASTIPAAELEKRIASFNARRNLLRTNPSLYISKTRLSIRQLPTFVTDRGLKRLAIHASRAFEQEVAEGHRQALTSDELLTADDQENQDQRKRKPKRGERATVVVQAKIVRQPERIDPLTGKARSKGYGFLEMQSHADALRVLRWANNNPSVYQLLEEWWIAEMKELMNRADNGSKSQDDDTGARIRRLKERVDELEEKATTRTEASQKKGKTLIVEFSIENVQVVKRRIEKVKRATSDDHNKPSHRAILLDRPKRRHADGEDADEEPRRVKRKVEASGEQEERGPHKRRGIGSIIGKKRREKKATRARRTG